MQISLNGQKADTGDGQTVADIVGRFGFSPETILIEHNGVALHRREWREKPLSDGDRLEIVRIAAGG